MFASKYEIERAESQKQRINNLVVSLEQIERLSRTADGQMVDVAAMLGDIARKALLEFSGERA
jgi:hypothetical protein